MKIGRKILAGAVLASAVSLAQADFYAGGNILYINYDESGVSDINPIALYGNVGKWLNDWLAVEARAGFGVRDDSARVFDVKADLELTHLVGAYVKAGIPNETMIFPYAVAGYSHLKAKVSVGSFSESDSGSDFSYGLGVDFRVTESAAVNLEYMRYYSKSGVDVDGITLGVNFRF